jgi:hypothetical protein
MGDCEIIDGKVGGLGVVIGARIGTLAEPSEVFVSQTIKDLTAGSGIVLTHRGEHAVKGVPDPWHLYGRLGSVTRRARRVTARTAIRGGAAGAANHMETPCLSQIPAVLKTGIG